MPALPGTGGWPDNWLGWGRGTHAKDIMEAKPRAAVLETEAASGQRLQDIKRSLSDPAVAIMVRNGNIMRLAVIVSGAVLAYIFIFVLLGVD